ncbi:MAG TPA: hypothetical protein VHB27_18165 [Rhodopila sp.]|uniref:hypothetical protein n=1 Tax=Rhodopila sp. TaxID=2480087 RepID=UPI002CA18553|nr:hypothetical protein [Rhodopila sp.]HVY17154.1 hypothetical protein [Rhodopila sp.]
MDDNPDALRAMAERYDRMARTIKDQRALKALKELAQEYRDRADAISRGTPRISTKQEDGD